VTYAITHRGSLDMCVCVYKHICVYIHVYLYMYVFIHVYICIYPHPTAARKAVVTLPSVQKYYAVRSPHTYNTYIVFKERVTPGAPDAISPPYGCVIPGWHSHPFRNTTRCALSIYILYNMCLLWSMIYKREKVTPALLTSFPHLTAVRRSGTYLHGALHICISCI